MKYIHTFGLALQFLTRLPVPSGCVYSAETRSWSVVWYPVVGLLMGCLLLLLQWLLGTTGPLLSAALILSAWVSLTGGLHLDGLADSADAWVGGQGDRERSLRIMQDPCSGPIAVAAVVIVLVLKFAALAELLVQPKLMPLLWAPVIGRSIAPLLLLTTPYVRRNGLGSPLVENLPRLPASLSATLFPLAAFFALGLWPLLVTALVVGCLRLQMLKKLGGCTGDTLGASIELGEAVALVVCALG